MNDTELNEAKNIADTLIKRAEEGKNSSFEFIRTYGTWITAITLKKNTYKIYKIFLKESKNFYKQYLAALKNHIDYVQLLANHRQYKKWAEFYRKEALTYKNCLHEFYCFGLCRPIEWLLIMLFGYVRKDEDLIDYSGKGFKEDDRK